MNGIRLPAISLTFHSAPCVLCEFIYPNRVGIGSGSSTDAEQSEFGLSPVSRTRLTIENPDDSMAELEAILRGPRLTDEEREKAMQ